MQRSELACRLTTGLAGSLLQHETPSGTGLLPELCYQHNITSPFAVVARQLPSCYLVWAVCKWQNTLLAIQAILQQQWRNISSKGILREWIYSIRLLDAV